MKNAIAGALLLGSLTCGSAAFAQEGVYRITERENCAAELIDSIVIYKDLYGEWRAALSNEEHGIRYQDHVVTWSGDFVIGGETTPDSPDGAILQGTFSLDFSTLQGTVDAVSCPGPWSFVAEQVTPGGPDVELEPLGQDPIDFAGIYAASVASLSGQLRLMTLPSGRMVANFRTAHGRLISFQEARFAEDADVLDLFTIEDDRYLVKWSLGYGMRDGRLTLAGLGFTMNGRVYRIFATRP